MDEAAVRLEFGQGFAGVLRGGSAEVPVGQGGGLRPYELLLGALGSCFYSTFLGIAAKMRLEYDGARVDVRGVKRDEVPTTLKDAWLTFTIIGAKDEKGFRRAAELAAKYCSVHETLSKVADIRLDVAFEEGGPAA